MKLKIIIVALMAILSGIFFWQTTNRFLYPSKAADVPSTDTNLPPTPLPTGLPAGNTGGTTPGGATPGLPTGKTGGNNPRDCLLLPRADITCDGKIDLLDFDALRKALFP